MQNDTHWRLNPPAREMIHKLRDRPVALQLDTDQATWGIAYEKYMPYSASLGSLRLWHRPAGQQRFHDQVCIEFADKKGRGLRALIQYIRQHDIDYLEGDPTVFSYRLIDVHELVQAIDARYFAQQAIDTATDWSDADVPEDETLEIIQDTADRIASMYGAPGENDDSRDAIAMLREQGLILKRIDLTTELDC